MTTIQKINNFGRLPVGWHYGSGSPASEATIARARLFAVMFGALGYSKTDAFPGIDGEVMITAYEGDHYLEITLELDGTLRFAYEEGENELIYVENLSPYEANTYVLEVTEGVKPGKWHSLELSTQSTTLTSINGNSKIWHFALNGMEMGTARFPALEKIALSRKAGVSAPTSNISTNPSHLIQRSSGFSINQPCHQVAA